MCAPPFLRPDKERSVYRIAKFTRKKKNCTPTIRQEQQQQHRQNNNKTNVNINNIKSNCINKTK